MSRVRFAVIGAGHLGKIHTRLISQNPRAELVAVVDPVQNVAQTIADEHGTVAMESYQDLPGKIDAAIVAAPTVAHEKIARDLIDVGIHVFVEKPITVHPAQARRLINAAARRNVALQVGHVEQFNPAWQVGVKLIDCPNFVSAHRCAPFSFRSTDISVVHDLMIHDIDLLLSVMDCPYTSVSAWGQSVLTDHDDTATAWIEFEDGRMANLTASRVHHAPVRQMHLHEQTRQIVIDFANASVVELAAVASLGSMTMEQIRELQSNGLDSVASITNHDVVPGNAIEQEHNDFIDSILLHRQPRVHGERGHDALVLADRIVSEIGRNFGRNSLRPAA